VSDDLKRLADAAASLESQARELREEIEKLAQAEAEPTPVEEADEPAVDDSEARIVAFSMVLDGKPRDEVAEHLADEFGLADSGSLLDDLYARAAG
jgi:predicted RNA-binding Zn ribbon-like protein